jgi:hypothetical protein
VSDRGISPPQGTDGRGVPAVARARLAAELHEELARTRLAWAAATLRGDAARQTGDRATAERALAEQRTLLRDLHSHVDAVVGRALLEREAAAIVPPPPGPSTTQRAPTVDRPEVERRPVRGRVGAVLGVVAAAVAGVLVAGTPQAPPAPTVTPVAEREAPGGPAGPAASAPSDRGPDRSRSTSEADDPGGESTGVPDVSGEDEPAGSTGGTEPTDGAGLGRAEDEPDARVDVPSSTGEVEDAPDDPLGPAPAPGDDGTIPDLRLELPTLLDDEDGHLSFRSPTG